MTNEVNLPQGWEWARIDDLGLWRGGGTPSKQKAEYWSGSLMWVSPKDMKSKTIIDTLDKITQEAVAHSATQMIPPASVLVVTRSGILAHTLPVATTTNEVTINQDLKALTPAGSIPPEFVAHWFRASEQIILSDLTKAGTTVASIDFPRFKAHKLPIPPLNEQRRIADKIDALQAKSRRAREALETVKPLLEKFRQSVLAAAFRGDLTAEWRKQNPDVESASILLERIRTERRARWEEAELAKMRAKGKEPKNDKWKAKYKEPAPVDASGLPKLPEGWCWGTIEELTSLVTSGSRGWGKYYSETGALFLRVGNLDRDSIELDLSQTVYVTPPEGGEGTRTRVETGDLLLSITADVGMVAVAKEFDKAYINQHVALIRPCSSVNSTLLAYSLSDPMGLQKIVKEIQYGMTKASLSLIQVRSLPVPVPPVDEQEELVVVLHRHDKKIAKIKDYVKQETSVLPILDQSILAKAFRGELVPQDPNDEPVSVLLERIKAEREAHKGKKKRRRK